MNSSSTDRRTKVENCIQEYDLDGMGPQLEEAWIGEDGERTSLRNLADEFNQAVLEATLRNEGISPTKFEISGTYEALRSESGSEKKRAERRLERRGIDPEQLSDSFVSHQAIHTYLKSTREASLPENKTDQIQSRVEAIEKLKGRVSTVTESAIDSLASADHLNHDDYDVLVDVKAVCPDCGSDISIRELLRNGECECEINPD
jgi:hypothetical protein